MAVWEKLRLEGKRAFITGGSRGLGRAIALALAEAGADVALVGRNPDSLAQTAADIRRLGRSALELPADVSDRDTCRDVCQRALELWPEIHILVNNAGGRRINVPIEQMTMETWQQMLDLNLTSAVICCQVLGPKMAERRWGRIINIASINSFVITRGIGGRHYETAKAALVQWTRALAADWAPYGVTVNAICPGGFMTEANERWSREHPEVIATFLSQIPMGRFGEPEELGPLAVYLASDASAYMTGSTLVIDGGYTLW